MARSLVQLLSEKMPAFVRPAGFVDGCPVVLVKGAACAGKSVLLSSALQSLRLSPPTHRPHIISFAFIPGGQREGPESDAVAPGPGRAGTWGLSWALELLASDISSQVGRTSLSANHPLAHLAVDMVMAWRWHKLRAQADAAGITAKPSEAEQQRWSLSKMLFAEAVLAAILAPNAGEGSGQKPSKAGYAVVCVVDGLNDEQVGMLLELVETLYSEVLVHLTNLAGLLPVLKVVASCASLPRSLLKVKVRDPSQVRKGASSSATRIAALSRAAGLTFRDATAIFELQPPTEAEATSLAWWNLLSGSGAGPLQGLDGHPAARGFPLTCSFASTDSDSPHPPAFSSIAPGAFCPSPVHIRALVAKVLSREKARQQREQEKLRAEEMGVTDKRPHLVIEGDALYLSAACHLSTLHDEDDRIAARLSELPVELADAFVQGVLVPLEVSHGLELVESLVLQLLAAPAGVTRTDLKLILAYQLEHLGNDAWLPFADMAVDRVLAALQPFLLPARGAEDNICLEHATLRLAAWRHYDPMTAPADARVLPQEEEVDASAIKKAAVGNLDGYVWVRGRVFSSMGEGDDDKVEVELLVTQDSPIAIHPCALYHIRKIPVPVDKKKTVEAVAEAKEVVTIAYKTPVARGLGQSWPYIDGPDDQADRPLLSTATHVTDESHYMSSLQRGFPAVPEKRYALTPFSAQVSECTENRHRHRLTRAG